MNLTVSYQVFADAILQDVKTLRLWTKCFQTVADFLQMKQLMSNVLFPQNHSLLLSLLSLHAA